MSNEGEGGWDDEVDGRVVGEVCRGGEDRYG
jgi:hypothetical protein